MNLFKLLTMFSLLSSIFMSSPNAVMIKLTGFPSKTENLPNDINQDQLDQFIATHAIEKVSLRFTNTKGNILKDVIMPADNLESQYPEKLYNWKRNFIESTKQPLTIKSSAQKEINIPLDWEIESIEYSYNDGPYQEVQRLFEGQILSDLPQKENATLYIKSLRYLYANTGNPPNVIPQTPGEQIVFQLSY